MKEIQRNMLYELNTFRRRIQRAIKDAKETNKDYKWILQEDIMEDITRAKWKEILHKIKKGGHQELKKYSETVANTAYKQGVAEGYGVGIQKGIDATKIKALEVVERVLRKDFGFGDKRVTKFTQSFLEEVNTAIEEIDEEQESTTQQIIVSEMDKDRYMYIYNIVEYIEKTLNVDDSSAISDAKSKYYLENAKDNLKLLLSSIDKKVAPETIDTMFKEMETYSLELVSHIYAEKKRVS